MRDERGFGNRSGVRCTYSASALGESILKDHALTAKLLRIINSAYISRFGGNVDNVQYAIVILGIDRVRLIALSICLFENQGRDAHTERVSESAVNSLMSGEIAQQFAPYAQVSDAEQAMLCGMLRNFGRHLVIGASRNPVALTSAPEPRFRTQDNESTTVVSEIPTLIKAARSTT